MACNSAPEGNINKGTCFKGHLQGGHNPQETRESCGKNFNLITRTDRRDLHRGIEVQKRREACCCVTLLCTKSFVEKALGLRPVNMNLDLVHSHISHSNCSIHTEDLGLLRQALLNGPMMIKYGAKCTALKQDSASSTLVQGR